MKQRHSEREPGTTHLSRMEWNYPGRQIRCGVDTPPRTSDSRVAIPLFIASAFDAPPRKGGVGVRLVTAQASASPT
jgi:hypothetical protein